VRMANARSNQIYEASLNMALLADETLPDGSSMRRFRDLPLQRQRTPIFALTWTAIHTVDETSPLYGLSREDLHAREAQIVVTLTGTDETFAHTVHARQFYGPDDMVWNARFCDILSHGADGRLRIDYTRFQQVQRLSGRRTDALEPAQK